jgi:hypothetical protein
MPRHDALALSLVAFVALVVVARLSASGPRGAA